jgi:hypothetical protein
MTGKEQMMETRVSVWQQMKVWGKEQMMETRVSV